MERREAYTITYAILGMLVRWGPMTGYDLKRWFDQGVGQVWPATYAQIYKELNRLQELGWAKMEREEQESRPDRKVYCVTSEGREALTAWLGERAEPLQLRDELLLKIIFGAFAAPGTLPEMLRAAITDHEQRLRRYQEELKIHGDPTQPDIWHQPLSPESPADPYVGLTVRLGVAFEEMYLRWLHETIELLASGEQKVSGDE